MKIYILFKKYNEIYHGKICINENINKIQNSNSTFNLYSILTPPTYQIYISFLYNIFIYIFLIM